MQAAADLKPVSKSALWTGRIASALVVLLLVFDGTSKVMKVPAVMKAAEQLKFSAAQIVGVGTLLLICTLIYVIPRTSVLGAILLTGYLGGAVITQIHAGMPMIMLVFPITVGIFAWGGLFLRDPDLRAFIPLRRRGA
ncbi:MAG: DoxX family protein [Candidatus Acidiferrales bacterium]